MPSCGWKVFAALGVCLSYTFPALAISSQERASLAAAMLCTSIAAEGYAKGSPDPSNDILNTAFADCRDDWQMAAQIWSRGTYAGFPELQVAIELKNSARPTLIRNIIRARKGAAPATQPPVRRSDRAF